MEEKYKLSMKSFIPEFNQNAKSGKMVSPTPQKVFVINDVINYILIENYLLICCHPRIKKKKILF